MIFEVAFIRAIGARAQRRALEFEVSIRDNTERKLGIPPGLRLVDSEFGLGEPVAGYLTGILDSDSAYIAKALAPLSVADPILHDPAL